jgi:hypothetical protein
MVTHEKAGEEGRQGLNRNTHLELQLKIAAHTMDLPVPLYHVIDSVGIAGQNSPLHSQEEGLLATSPYTKEGSFIRTHK